MMALIFPNLNKTSSKKVKLEAQVLSPSMLYMVLYILGRLNSLHLIEEKCSSNTLQILLIFFSDENSVKIDQVI